MHALVLSGSLQESSAFIRATEGLSSRNARHVTRASSVAGVRPAAIYVLPSYYHRPDRHAIDAALRHLKRKFNIRVEELDWEWVRRPAAHVAGPDEIAGQTTLEEQLAQSERGRVDIRFNFDAEGLSEGLKRLVQKSWVDEPQYDKGGVPPGSSEVVNGTGEVIRVDSNPLESEEEFCPDCAAGIESSEHHEKCVIPARERAEELLGQPLEDEIVNGKQLDEEENGAPEPPAKKKSAAKKATKKSAPPKEKKVEPAPFFFDEDD